MSAFNSGSQDFYDKVNLFGPTPEELGSETTYKENFEASLANFKYEWMSNSEEGIIGDPIKEQLNKLKTLKIQTMILIILVISIYLMIVY